VLSSCSLYLPVSTLPPQPVYQSFEPCPTPTSNLLLPGLLLLPSLLLPTLQGSPWFIQAPEFVKVPASLFQTPISPIAFAIQLDFLYDVGSRDMYQLAADGRLNPCCSRRSRPLHGARGIDLSPWMTIQLAEDGHFSTTQLSQPSSS